MGALPIVLTRAHSSEAERIPLKDDVEISKLSEPSNIDD